MVKAGVSNLKFRIHWGRQTQIQVVSDALPFTSNADVPGRQVLRSVGTDRLVVPPVRLSTIGSRAIPVAAAQIWNSLPEHIVLAPALQSFRRHSKTFLLQQSFCL